MDVHVQLALIEKSKRVFAADPEVFLSFPLVSPLSFTPQALAALSTPASTSDYAASADFARIVNFIPRDMVASGYGDRYLWDVYADVLSRADVADGSVDKVSQESSSGPLLYHVASDGTRTETAVYQAYRQYRDAWIVAREDYGAHKLTGELTNNPEVSRHWAEVEEPALRAALAKAEADWKVIGHRDEVEAALQAEHDAAVNDPHARWQEWDSAFNPDLDLITDVNGGRYAPTGLSPKDFIGDTAWLHFDLPAGEIAKLVDEAPAALKVVLDGAAGNAIDHVSFDYRSMGLVRPWFQSSVLTSRIWRSSIPELMLSDGNDPPSGACPGYVAAVVFIRNLQVIPHAAPTAAPVAGGLRFTLPVGRLTPRDLMTQPVVPLRVAPAPVATPPPVTVQRAFSRIQNQTLAPAPTLAARPVVSQFEFWPSAAVFPRRVPIGVMPRPSPLPLVPASAPASPERHDEISILAFICKRLPKVPEPMPNLHWS